MKKTLSASAAAALALAIAMPAFAGGANCGSKASAATASNHCASKSSATAWGGAWVQRTSAGKFVVADVAKGSPAARSGLKAGDVVIAVNGYDLGDAEDRAMCASKAECAVGSAVTYRVQRGNATKSVKFKLEKMPNNATDRFGSTAAYDPTLAAVVTTTIN